MKYLNLGCGSHFVENPEWINVDFVSNSESVLSHDLLNGIPFEDSRFDVVYHSHVLEHFSKNDGIKFIEDCYRVLKGGGFIRIAVPDLEGIVKSYLKCLNQVLEAPEDSICNENYDWSIIELFDQMIRNRTGGLMLEVLGREQLANEDFVFERIGVEGRALREKMLKSPKKESKSLQKTGLKRFASLFKRKHEIGSTEALKIGRFRLEGEIHQWMYDRFSLTRLLDKTGFKQIVVRSAFDSYLPTWKNYQLDGVNGVVRKPDSLFVEAIKC